MHTQSHLLKNASTLVARLGEVWAHSTMKTNGNAGLQQVWGDRLV